MRKRKKVAAMKPAAVLMVGAALPLLAVAAASADPAIGAPEVPECHGMTISGYVRADAAEANGELNYGGLKRAAEMREMSVRQLQAQVMDLCMMGMPMM